MEDKNIKLIEDFIHQKSQALMPIEIDDNYDLSFNGNELEYEKRLNTNVYLISTISESEEDNYFEDINTMSHYSHQNVFYSYCK